MFLMFNKQYRMEEKLVSELAKKIKKSSHLEVSYVKNEEIYTLDNLSISFDVTSHQIVVSDKSGQEITFLNCAYSEHDDFQQARYNWFHHLLCDVARKRKKEEEEKQKQKEAMQKAARVTEAENNMKQQHQCQLRATLAALDKIRGL